MCEVSVRSGCDSKGCTEQNDELKEIREAISWQIEEAVDCCDV